MSQRYKGAVISATPPTTTGGNSGTAPGIWTMQQQLQAQGAGNWPNQPIWYVEDVFSTWLYTGNGTLSRPINNGIDLAGKGGMVWTKQRDGTDVPAICDTARGIINTLLTNTTDANISVAGFSSVTSTGYVTSSTNPGYFGQNDTGKTLVSWTFRKQPKFFDIQTYTTNSGTGAFATISHNLGSVPGFILVKATNQTDDWYVYHRSNGSGKYMVLNSTAAVQTDAGFFSSVTSTQVVGLPNYASGTSYVVYLFAHNAGGFGLTGTDNVISCGSYNGVDGAAVSVNLGYEPQWLLIKRTDASASWWLLDTMRGLTADGPFAALFANGSGSELNFSPGGEIRVNATGFSAQPGTGFNSGSSSSFIYIAIRRGPMKTPTSVTGFFTPVTQSNANPVTYTAGFPVDLVIHRNAIGSSVGEGFYESSRLIGPKRIKLWQDFAEESTTAKFDSMTTVTVSPGSTDAGTNSAHLFRRAPGFMDVVCYAGTGSVTTVTHNLGVAPELIIVKSRSGSQNWTVWASSLIATDYLFLNTTDAQANYTGGVYWGTGAKTSTTFSVGISNATNASGSDYVAYLFASCPGVSKVGSYAGTSGTQTISCGFAARYVLIKRTDSTGDWLVWDTARGMVAGTDPRIGYNITTAQVNNNWVYTDASGFQIVTTDASVNASGGSYIYLAIA